MHHRVLRDRFFESSSTNFKQPLVNSSRADLIFSLTERTFDDCTRYPVFLFQMFLSFEGPKTGCKGFGPPNPGPATSRVRISKRNGVPMFCAIQKREKSQIKLQCGRNECCRRALRSVKKRLVTQNRPSLVQRSIHRAWMHTTSVLPRFPSRSNAKRIVSSLC